MKYIHYMHNTDASRALEGLLELVGILADSMQRELDTLGLTRARAEVVWRLAWQGSMTQKDLSRALQCTPRNVTGLLDALENSRLVVRRPHPNDRRATLVSLKVPGTQERHDWAKGYKQLASTVLA